MKLLAKGLVATCLHVKKQPMTDILCGGVPKTDTY